MDCRRVRMSENGFAEFMAVLTALIAAIPDNGRIGEASRPLGTGLRGERLTLGAVDHRSA